VPSRADAGLDTVSPEPAGLDHWRRRRGANAPARGANALRRRLARGLLGLPPALERQATSPWPRHQACSERGGACSPRPSLLSYVVAIYLIVIGVLGLVHF
jgi:hypothetical protein